MDKPKRKFRIVPDSKTISWYIECKWSNSNFWDRLNYPSFAYPKTALKYIEKIKEFDEFEVINVE